MHVVLRSAVRVLGRDDLDEALSVCALDPVANVFVASRLLTAGLASRSAGEVWGYHDGGRLRALCWSGANLVPVEADAGAVEAFAARARRGGRQCSSLVGPAPAVLAMWERLRGHWGPPREVRAEQPLMAIDGPPLVAADPLVRRSGPADLDAVLPACVAMFTEEVGYSPVAADGGALYGAQVRALVQAGRSFVRTDGPGPGGRVVFKAEIGSVSPQAVQVQGVWVDPADRGRGLAAPAMAAVVERARERFAPTVSLYVNAYNHRAERVYHRVGFRRRGTFATVLF